MFRVLSCYHKVYFSAGIFKSDNVEMFLFSSLEHFHFMKSFLGIWKMAPDTRVQLFCSWFVPTLPVSPSPFFCLPSVLSTAPKHLLPVSACFWRSNLFASLSQAGSASVITMSSKKNCIYLHFIILLSCKRYFITWIIFFVKTILWSSCSSFI